MAICPGPTGPASESISSVVAAAVEAGALIPVKPVTQSAATNSNAFERFMSPYFFLNPDGQVAVVTVLTVLPFTQVIVLAGAGFFAEPLVVTTGALGVAACENFT